MEIKDGAGGVSGFDPQKTAEEQARKPARHERRLKNPATVNQLEERAGRDLKGMKGAALLDIRVPMNERVQNHEPLRFQAEERRPPPAPQPGERDAPNYRSAAPRQVNRGGIDIQPPAQRAQNPAPARARQANIAQPPPEIRQRESRFQAAMQENRELNSQRAARRDRAAAGRRQAGRENVTNERRARENAEQTTAREQRNADRLREQNNEERPDRGALDLLA